MKLLFIVNQGSGSSATDFPAEIRTHFDASPHEAELFELPKDFDPDRLRNKIDTSNAERIVAVGGDGTIKLVAECVLGTDKTMAIVPGGSANGLAKELGIPMGVTDALALCTQEKCHAIHVTKVNEQLCIHLSDIGFNAFVVKKFEDEKTRGMWGYVKAAFKTLRNAPYMDVRIFTGKEEVVRRAAMVVIANGTRYGSGAVINPQGRIDDFLFEIVIVRKISFSEIFKMMVTHRPYDPQKTEVFQSREATIHSKKRAHFQVDGEYLGKLHSVKASIVPHALNVVLPKPRQNP
ncbi:MAG: diacylglycerol kinase family lipid kinase [Chitinophagaceae bacterium]|nr:MAG: diacylglycerol kinase family lipid kinase [Chitinophagaceae bacterium]